MGIFPGHICGPRPESFLPLTAVAFEILLSLADGELHGYDIMREVCGAQQRTAEIGIRMALGARAATLQGLVMRDGLRAAWCGLFVGIIASLLLTRYVTSLLFAVTPTDPATFAALVVAMLAVTSLACYLPARRASQLDPLRAIRID